MVTADKTGISTQAKQVLDSLKALGPGWHTRAEIARQMGISRVTAKEATLLAYLKETGKIDIRQEESSRKGTIGYRWEYWVK